MQHERILRRPAVQDAIGLSRSALYELISRGEFPRPVRLGKRAVGWRASEVAAWIETRQSSVG